MSAHNIIITAGQDFSHAFSYFPLGVANDPQDWTGFTGSAQVRRKVDDDDVLLELDVTLDAEGRVLLTALAADTADLRPMAGVWDVAFVNGSVRIGLPGGVATIRQPVTR